MQLAKKILVPFEQIDTAELFIGTTKRNIIYPSWFRLIFFYGAVWDNREHLWRAAGIKLRFVSLVANPKYNALLINPIIYTDEDESGIYADIGNLTFQVVL